MTLESTFGSYAARPPAPRSAKFGARQALHGNGDGFCLMHAENSDVPPNCQPWTLVTRVAVAVICLPLSAAPLAVKNASPLPLLCAFASAMNVSPSPEPTLSQVLLAKS